MTREEAIKNLEALLLKANITDVYGDMEDMTPYEDTVNMAIQALKQGPKQSISCDASDCIYCIYDPEAYDWKCERVHINIDVDCMCGNWEEDIEDEELLDGDLEDQFEKILDSIDAGKR